MTVNSYDALLKVNLPSNVDVPARGESAILTLSPDGEATHVALLEIANAELDEINKIDVTEYNKDFIR